MSVRCNDCLQASARVFWARELEQSGVELSIVVAGRKQRAAESFGSVRDCLADHAHRPHRLHAAQQRLLWATVMVTSRNCPAWAGLSCDLIESIGVLVAPKRVAPKEILVPTAQRSAAAPPPLLPPLSCGIALDDRNIVVRWQAAVSLL